MLNSVFRSTFEALKGAAAYEDGSAEHIEGIAVDGSKITLTFEKVAPDALLTFTQFAPLPKKYLADTDPISLQQAKYFQSPVGSGPFMVDEVQMNNYTTLKPFDKYYGGTANFTIHLNPSAGDSDANFVTNAKAGKLDYAYTKNIADVKALEGTPGLTIDTVNVRYTRLLYLNKFDKKDGKKAPLADERVRQAIAYALDMKSILDGVFEGAALPANSLTPDGADKVDGLNNYDYNPEKAKELLKEAGYEDTDGDGIVEKDGEPLSLRLVFQTEEYASWKSLCEYLKSEYEKVGVGVELVEKESAAYYDEIWNTRDYDLCIYRSYEDSWMPHGFLKSMFYAEDGAKAVNWYDEELNKDLGEVLKTQDEEKRTELYDKILTRINDQAVTVPLYYPNRDYIYNNTRLTNVELAPTAYEGINWATLDVVE